MYSLWSLLDLQKVMRQFDKDSRSCSKWMVLLLSILALDGLLRGDLFFPLSITALAIWETINIFKCRSEIKKADEKIQETKRKITHLYMHGLKEE